MRKLAAILCLTLIASPVFADGDFKYQNQRTLNDINSIQTKGCNEYVKLEPKNAFDPAANALPNRSFGRTFARNAIAGGLAGGALLAMVMDPYVVTIDGVNYVMVVDRKDKNWSKEDLLGYNDPKTNRFASLIALNSDGDHSKLTADELKKANIRFVRMDSKGVLLVNERNKDYSLNKIDYIDIINLKRTANAETTGIFGHFTMYLKTTNAKKKAVVGHVTYETNEKIEYLFK